MQAFIQHLLFDVLIKRTQDKVLALFRKLHWKDEEVGLEMNMLTFRYTGTSFKGLPKSGKSSLRISGLWLGWCLICNGTTSTLPLPCLIR